MAYRKVTQWQGKEMRNLGWCVLGVLALELRQPGSAQLILFKRTLECVRALGDFNIRVEYGSHTAETITYTEEYLDTFHKMKDICLDFGVTKHIRTEMDEQPRKL